MQRLHPQNRLLNGASSQAVCTFSSSPTLRSLASIFCICASTTCQGTSQQALLTVLTQGPQQVAAQLHTIAAFIMKLCTGMPQDAPVDIGEGSTPTPET